MHDHASFVWIAALALAMSLAAGVRAADAPPLRLHVDATDIARKLVHATLEVPAAPGDAGFAFLGIVFDDARIARVRISSGSAVPGADDDRRRDVVVMDDFVFGEPHLVQ